MSHQIKALNMQRDIALGMIEIVKTREAKAHFKIIDNKLWQEIKALDPIPDEINNLSDDELLKALGMK